MIQLTLRDGRKHLFNPNLIQEVGSYTCTQHGLIRPEGRTQYDTGPLEERNFVVMRGCEPLDIVETSAAVALLRASWAQRSDLSPFAVTTFVLLGDDDTVAFMGVGG